MGRVTPEAGGMRVVLQRLRRTPVWVDLATTPPAVPVAGRNDRRREEALFVAVTTGTYLLILLLITGLFVVARSS